MYTYIYILWVEKSNNNERGKEVDDGGAQHHVEWPVRLLVEGDSAPGRLFKLNIIVLKVVHLNKLKKKWFH